jgi:hypothetical protein
MTHIAVRIALLATTMLLSGTLHAQTSAYYECSITSGQIFSCDGSWYQGRAVVLRNGAYHECTITNGQVFSCDGSWYQGRAVVLR